MGVVSFLFRTLRDAARNGGWRLDGLARALRRGGCAPALPPVRPAWRARSRRTVSCRDVAAESVKPTRPTATGG